MKADRFDEAMMGIKKAYKPDYLDSENTIFINKLNFVTKHYEDTYRHVKNLLVHQKDHKLLLEDVELEVKDLKEENKFLKHRIDGIE